MKCPTCQQKMVPCQMDKTHSMCLHCSDTMASAMGICRPCLNEYDASVRSHLIHMAHDPEAANKLHWCDDCNDWMPLQHQHKTRKKWLG